MRPRLLSLEHLRLLLAIAASEMEDRPNESEALAAKAVTRAPALLLRALDRSKLRLEIPKLGLSSFAPVVQRFNELLRKCGLCFPARLIEGVATSGTCSGNFSRAYHRIDGAHWAEWFLLRAAVELARKRHDRTRRTAKNFSMSIFAGSALGKKSWRSPTLAESNHRARRFAF